MKNASKLLESIDDILKDEAITVKEFVSLLGDRSFALAILIFSLPNSLPIPGIPGLSTITGLPLLFIALQMVWGKDTIWLPENIARREISQHLIRKVLQKSLPIIRWLEKFLHPRLDFFCNTKGERVIGLLISCMAIILSLPIVGGNFLPGLSISLLAIALLERDGLFALISMAFCLLSLYFLINLVEWVIGTSWEWLTNFL